MVQQAISIRYIKCQLNVYRCNWNQVELHEFPRDTFLHIDKIEEGKSSKHTYLNSNHISRAEPGGKNLLQDRTREVIVSKCRCLSLHPSGPVFLYHLHAKKVDCSWHLQIITCCDTIYCKSLSYPWPARKGKFVVNQKFQKIYDVKHNSNKNLKINKSHKVHIYLHT